MTPNPTPAVTFIELVRRRQAGEATPGGTWFWCWCELCQEEQRHFLTGEVGLQEVYACEHCGNARVYTVR
jgi:hypothetical protein